MLSPACTTWPTGAASGSRVPASAGGVRPWAGSHLFFLLSETGLPQARSGRHLPRVARDRGIPAVFLNPALTEPLSHKNSSRFFGAKAAPKSPTIQQTIEPQG